MNLYTLFLAILGLCSAQARRSRGNPSQMARPAIAIDSEATGISTHSDLTQTTKFNRRQPRTASSNTLASIRGGRNVLDPLDQGKVMTARTALKYKAGLIAETGVLLAVLKAGREAHIRSTGHTSTIIEYVTLASVIFLSDGIIGLLRKVEVRLGLAKPRQTLAESTDNWYQNIRKPSWTPPNVAFPLIWIPLKLLQLGAARIVWNSQRHTVLNVPMVLFVLHQALGDLWNTAFFREHYLEGGLSIILQFAAVLFATTWQFSEADKLAGLMMAPTCVWVCIASALNADIWRLNK